MNPRLAILRACKDLITPWARFLLRQGVSYREFDDVVRAVFVEIATKEFGIRGRPTNASRVAVLTGLTRKQIKKIRELLEDSTVEETASHNQATVVLSAWFGDPDFLDTKGAPKTMPFEGSTVSFSELVRKYGRDIPPRAMLRELKRTGAVEELTDGHIRALNRFNVFAGCSPQSIERYGFAIRNFISTAVYNLTKDEDDIGRFERRSYSRELTEADRKRFDVLVRERGNMLLEELEDWIGSRARQDLRTAASSHSDDAPLIGAGVYLISDNAKKRV